MKGGREEGGGEGGRESDEGGRRGWRESDEGREGGGEGGMEGGRGRMGGRVREGGGEIYGTMKMEVVDRRCQLFPNEKQAVLMSLLLNMTVDIFFIMKNPHKPNELYVNFVQFAHSRESEMGLACYYVCVLFMIIPLPNSTTPSVPV